MCTPETTVDKQAALSLQSPRLTRGLVPAPRSLPLPLKLNGPHAVAQGLGFYPGEIRVHRRLIPEHPSSCCHDHQTLETQHPSTGEWINSAVQKYSEMLLGSLKGTDTSTPHSVNEPQNPVWTKRLWT